MARHPAGGAVADGAPDPGADACAVGAFGRQLGKLALPVSDAQYYALLSRAYEGGATRREMRWEISLAEGWGMIHAAGLLNGENFIWSDPRLSESGRAMLRVKAMRERFAEGTWEPEVDL